jgi:hypothetical protein
MCNTYIKTSMKELETTYIEHTVTVLLDKLYSQVSLTDPTFVFILYKKVWHLVQFIY